MVHNLTSPGGVFTQVGLFTKTSGKFGTASRVIVKDGTGSNANNASSNTTNLPFKLPAMVLMSSGPNCASKGYTIVSTDDNNNTIESFPLTGDVLVVYGYQNSPSKLIFASIQPNSNCSINDFNEKDITNRWSDFGAQWLDPTHIKYLGSNDVYSESGYNNGIMTLNGPTNSCGTDTITVGTDPTSSYQSATAAAFNEWVEENPGTPDYQCHNQKATLALTNKHTDVAITAQWPANTADLQDPTGATINITKNTYKVYDSQSGTVTDDSINDSSFAGSSIDNTNTFTLFSNYSAAKGTPPPANRCLSDTNSIDTMTIADYQSAISATITKYFIASSGFGSTTCKFVTVPFVDLLNTFGNPTPSGGNGNPPSGDTCPVDASDETRWITCPSLNFLDKAAVAINGFIGLFLVFPVDEFFTGATQNVFNTFRDLGVALLVIAGLIMVVSQAADLEIFSAHTVRKALPRIIIAAIGITLAWPLLQFTIIFFNDLGTWIGKIIIDIAAGTQGSGAGFGGFVLDALTTIIAGIATTAWLGSFTIGGLLALLLSVILFLLLGLFVLLLRQIVILLCVLAAPLAIAAYILPGTEKLWRFWKDTLLTTLLMFPIIMAFLSAGAAMGHITGSVSGNPLFSVLSLFFYVVPYAMIPFAFKLAGGAMSQIISLAEGQHHKSIESKLAGYRANEQKWKKQQFLEGRRENARWNVPGRIGTWFSRHAAEPGGWTVPTARNRATWAANLQKQRTLTAMNALKEDQGMAANDDIANELASQRGMTRDTFVRDYMAASGGTREQAERALAMLETSYKTRLGTQVMRQAALSAALRSTTSFRSRVAGGTNADVADLREGTSRMYATAGQLVADGIISNAQAVQAIKFNENAAARRYTQGSYGETLDLVNEATEAARGNRGALTQGEMSYLYQRAFEQSSPGDILGGRPETLQAFAPISADQVRAAAGNIGTAGGRTRLAQTLARNAALLDGLGHVSPEKAQIWGENSNLANITINGRTVSLQDLMLAVESNSSQLESPTGYNLTSAERQELVSQYRSLRRVFDTQIASYLASEPSQN